MDHSSSTNFDTKEAARYLKRSKSTLEKLRHKGDGPPYSQPGRKVTYRKADLDAWLEGSRVQSTSARHFLASEKSAPTQVQR